jgi:hypothetical protein
MVTITLDEIRPRAAQYGATKFNHILLGENLDEYVRMMNLNAEQSGCTSWELFRTEEGIGWYGR